MSNKKAIDSLCTMIENWKLDACVMKMIVENPKLDDSQAFGISVLLHKEFKRIVQEKLYMAENLENEMKGSAAKGHLVNCFFKIEE